MSTVAAAFLIFRCPAVVVTSLREVPDEPVEGPLLERPAVVVDADELDEAVEVPTGQLRSDALQVG